METAGYGTLVIPFEAYIDGEVEAWTLSAVSDNKVRGTKVSTIEANRPVLLKNEGTVELTAKNGTIAYNDSPEEGLLRGVYESSAAPVNAYVLQKQDGAVGFYQVESGNQPTIKPFRAYLTAATSAHKLTIDFSDETQGITVITEESMAGKSNVYNLLGHKVSHPQNGLYIVNGKKLFIK